MKLLTLSALLLCASLPSHAATNSSGGASQVANKFVEALQHHRYDEAAAMLAPAIGGTIAGTGATLKRIDDSLGGFATLHPITALPDGKSVKLDVAAPLLNGQQFVQLRYAATASDGQPVFYELDLAADGTSPRILSFGLHFPAADGRSAQRADRLVKSIVHPAP